MKMPEETLQMANVLLDALSEYVLFMDPQMRIQWANRAAAESSGMSFDEMRGLRCYQVWHERTAICPDCPIARVFETGQPQEGEMTSPETRHWSIRGYPIRDEQGQILGAAEIAVDITALKQAQQALEESEAKYAALVENARDAIVILQDGVCKYINKAAEEIFGYTLADLQNRPFLELVDPESRESTSERYQSYFLKGIRIPRLYSARVFHKDGTVRDVESTGAIIDYQGSPAALGIFRDVTDRRKSEQALRESEERFRALAEGAFDGVAIHEKGVILEVNDAFERIFGLEPGEAIGKPVLDFAAPESRETVKTNILSGHDKPYPSVGLRKDGSRVYGELLGRNVRYRGRDARVTAIRDLTDYKKAESALKESEERYRSLIQTCPDAITLTNMDGKLITANEQAARIHGYGSVDEFLAAGKTAFDFIAPEDLERSVENAQKTLENGLIRNIEYTLTREDGGRFPAELSASVILDAEGRPHAFVGVVRDITERKQVEEALRASEEFSSTLLNSTPNGIIVMNPDTSVQYVNRAFEKLTGYSAEEIVGRKEPYPWWVEESHRQSAQELKDAMGGKIHRLEQHFRKKSGERFWVEAFPVRVEWEGELKYCVSNWVDITERKRAELALRDSEERYRTLVQTSPDAIVMTDMNSKLIMANQQTAKLLGFDSAEEVLEKVVNVFAYIDPEYQETALRKLGEYDRTRGTRASVYRLVRRDKGSVIAEVNTSVTTYADGNLSGVIAVIRDITDRVRAEEERRKLQDQIQHAQKLESLGILAGGIAHDFNNLLMGVLGNASLALLDLPADTATRHYVEQIEKTARAAAELTNQMLAYSGKGRFVVESVDLSRLVEEMAGLLKISISKKVSLKFDFEKDLPPVEADASQIRQVVMNLITNAAEAIGDASGVVSVRTGVMHADRAFLTETYMQENLQEGPYVYLEVSDTGSGMENDILGRIFDPFFTTKFTGRGLGLAAVLGIVRGHKGAIRVQSAPGKGTTFRVLFPPAKQARATLAPQAKKPPAAPAGGKILVIDDEQTVRDVTRRMLENAGFAVLEASDGIKAVEIFRDHQQEISAVLLDATMPHMDGLETFQRLRGINPVVPVILSSGYNEQEATERFYGKGLGGFIQKPYRYSELVDKMREVVGG